MMQLFSRIRLNSRKIPAKLQLFYKEKANIPNFRKNTCTFAVFASYS